jgi:hypothetical protein
VSERGTWAPAPLRGVYRRMLVSALAQSAIPGVLTGQREIAAAPTAEGRDASAPPGPRFFALGTDGRRFDAVDAAILQRRVSLTLATVPLSLALQRIAERAGVDVTFSTELIPSGAEVSIKTHHMTIASALSWVLADARVDVLVGDHGRLTLVPQRIETAAADSSGALVAALVDADNGQPVPYGNVILLGVDIARAADDKGVVHLARVPARRYTLRARQTGYAPVDTTVTVAAQPARTTVTIRLTPIPALLDRVRVTGHGPEASVATSAPESPLHPTLGYGGLTWSPSGFQNANAITLPVSQYLFTWNATHGLSLGLHVGGGYAKDGTYSGSLTTGLATKSFTVGLEPDVYCRWLSCPRVRLPSRRVLHRASSPTQVCARYWLAVVL